MSDFNHNLASSLVMNANKRILFDTFASEFGAKRANQLAAWLNLDGATKIQVERDGVSLEVTQFSSVRINELMFDSLEKYGLKSFDFLCDHKRQTQEFNVYAIKKVAALALSYSMANMSEYCFVTLKNLLNLREKIESKKVVYTSKHQFCSFTHTLCDGVSKSQIKFAKASKTTDGTASTQLSSTNRAMAALHVYQVDTRGNFANINFDHAVFNTLK
jgi:hypothetical protein